MNPDSILEKESFFNQDHYDFKQKFKLAHELVLAYVKEHQGCSQQEVESYIFKRITYFEPLQSIWVGENIVKIMLKHKVIVKTKEDCLATTQQLIESLKG